MMGTVGRLGRSGPARPDAEPPHGHRYLRLGRAIEVRAGRVEFRLDKTGAIHVPIGKVSFDDDMRACRT